jgi:hypothetical protein
MTSRYDDLRKMREAKAAKMAKRPVMTKNNLLRAMFSPGVTYEWSTPQDFFDRLNRRFQFTQFRLTSRRLKRRVVSARKSCSLTP